MSTIYDVSKIKSLERDTYNVYKTPANLREAEEHYKAISVRKVISSRIKPGHFCKCCYAIKRTKRLPLCSGPNQ